MGLLDALMKEVAAVVGGADPAHQALASELSNMVTGRGGPASRASWISRHPNLPITPEQIQSVLCDEKVKELAEKAGISTQDASEAISRILPRIVDMATPSGQSPGSPIFDAISGFFKKS